MTNGSLVNGLYSRMVDGAPEPEVGMGATILLFTDRKAATVVDWNAKKRIVMVQLDKANRTDNYGMSDMQEYEYSPDPDGATYTFRLNKKGTWDHVVVNPDTGRFNKTGSYGLAVGFRKAYHDYSF